MVLTGGILATAMVFDVVFGEARAIRDRIPRPRQLFGRVAEALAARLGTGPDQRRAVLILGGGAAVLGLAIAWLPGGVLWQVLMATLALSHRSLIDGLREIANAFPEGLPAARAALARQTGQLADGLDVTDVAAVAIEHGAAVFARHVVGPAFWFLIAGLPGLFAFTAVGAASDRFGLGAERTDAFARSAARIADLMERIPARLTALLLALAGGRPAVLRVVRRDAARHALSNDGWARAAMAAVLGLRLGGPRRDGTLVTELVWMNEAAPRGATPTDIAPAIGLLWRAWLGLLALALTVWVAI